MRVYRCSFADTLNVKGYKVRLGSASSLFSKARQHAQGLALCSSEVEAYFAKFCNHFRVHFILRGQVQRQQTLKGPKLPNSPKSGYCRATAALEGDRRRLGKHPAHQGFLYNAC